MKLINLTQGKFAQADDADYDWLNQWKWTARKDRNTYYAVREADGKTIYMHRLIMNTPDNQEVDHRDRNGLNCQRNNMKNCSHAENLQNQPSRGKSLHKGVCLTNRGYITAQITINYKKIHLGTFPTEELAAEAYVLAAKKYFNN
jgi:hypothetical protein